ncbi:MAG TPA: hypothetical protein ENI27_07540 [bacterium]|nr:hypothetical protein [bacterium]
MKHGILPLMLSLARQAFPEGTEFDEATGEVRFEKEGVDGEGNPITGVYSMKMPDFFNPEEWNRKEEE